MEQNNFANVEQDLNEVEAITSPNNQQEEQKMDKWQEFAEMVEANQINSSIENINTWNDSVAAWNATEALYGELVGFIKQFAAVSIYSAMEQKEGTPPKTFGKNPDGTDQKCTVMIQKLANCLKFRDNKTVVKIQQKFRKVQDTKTRQWMDVPIYTQREMQNPIELVPIQAYILALTPEMLETYNESLTFFVDSQKMLSETFETIKKVRKIKSLTPPDVVEKVVGGTIAGFAKVLESGLKAINSTIDAAGNGTGVFSGVAHQANRLSSRITGQKKESAPRIAQVFDDTDIAG